MPAPIHLEQQHSASVWSPQINQCVFLCGKSSNYHLTRTLARLNPNLLLRSKLSVQMIAIPSYLEGTPPSFTRHHLTLDQCFSMSVVPLHRMLSCFFCLPFQLFLFVCLFFPSSMLLSPLCCGMCQQTAMYEHGQGVKPLELTRSPQEQTFLLCRQHLLARGTRTCQQPLLMSMCNGFNNYLFIYLFIYLIVFVVRLQSTGGLPHC